MKFNHNLELPKDRLLPFGVKNPPYKGELTISAQEVGQKQCNCAKLNECYVQDGKTICAFCGGELNMINPTA